MTVKLLIADDSVTIQKMVRLAFSDEDVVVESASSGDAALDSMRVFKPDIVLADVFMPGYGGYEVCARVKEDPQLARTPVILLVGAFEPFDELEASRVKSDGHLTKPFDTSELIQTVRLLVGDKMMPQKSDASVAPPAGVEQAPASSDPTSYKRAGGSVDPRVWESFLGSAQVLELFDPETMAKARLIAPAVTAVEAPSPVSKAKALELSEDTLNLIVDKVMKRMTTDVVREVAWEVVPELSEVLIRRVIEEQNTH